MISNLMRLELTDVKLFTYYTDTVAGITVRNCTRISSINGIDHQHVNNRPWHCGFISL